MVLLGMRKVDTGKADADVRLRQLARDDLLRSRICALVAGFACARQPLESRAFLRQIDQSVMIYGAGGGEDDAVGRVVAAQESSRSRRCSALIPLASPMIVCPSGCEFHSVSAK